MTSDQLAQQHRLQQWTQQVAQLTAAVTQTEKGIDQIEASIDQLDESIKQLDKQLDAADQQAQQTAEQRAKQEKLQDEQEALADVRAKPVKVKDVAKVQEVLAPTTVTQIEGTPSVTITATPEASDLGALTATIQSRLDSITDLPPGVTATLGGAAENQREAFTQLGLAMLVAIALVFMIMVGTFRSLVQPLILMVSIPVRCDWRDCRTADHRHSTRSAGHGGSADVDRNCGDQCDRADRSDQSVPAARRGICAPRSSTVLGCACGRSS